MYADQRTGFNASDDRRPTPRSVRGPVARRGCTDRGDAARAPVWRWRRLARLLVLYRATQHITFTSVLRSPASIVVTALRAAARALGQRTDARCPEDAIYPAGLTASAPRCI